MVGKARRWDPFLSGWREYEAASHMSEADRWQKGPGLEVKQDCTPQHQPPKQPTCPSGPKISKQCHHLGGTSIQTYKPEAHTITIPRISWKAQGEKDLP